MSCFPIHLAGIKASAHHRPRLCQTGWTSNEHDMLWRPINSSYVAGLIWNGHLQFYIADTVPESRMISKLILSSALRKQTRFFTQSIFYSNMPLSLLSRKKQLLHSSFAMRLHQPSHTFRLSFFYFSCYFPYIESDFLHWSFEHFKVIYEYWNQLVPNFFLWIMNGKSFARDSKFT